MATIPAYPCCIAVVYQAARGSRIRRQRPGPACLSFVVGEGVGKSNGNLFTHAQSLYIGEKLHLPDFSSRTLIRRRITFYPILRTSYFIL